MDRHHVLVRILAAAALVAANKVPDLPTGIRLAHESIDSGAAMAALERFVAFTQQIAVE